MLIWALTSGGGSGESGKHHVAITVRDYGTITVELDADAAPITVQNFLDLADSGFNRSVSLKDSFKPGK